ncbi:MAG: hypothetical protein ACTSPI_17250 [Candidatus Heimdallarchaeaceae archaeon]
MSRLKLEREICEYFEKKGENLETLRYADLAYKGYIPLINFILEMKLDLEKIKLKKK